MEEAEEGEHYVIKPGTAIRQHLRALARSIGATSTFAAIAMQETVGQLRFS